MNLTIREAKDEDAPAIFHKTPMHKGGTALITSLVVSLEFRGKGFNMEYVLLGEDLVGT